MRSPYVFVGGKLEVEGNGAEFALSWDGKTWQKVEDNLDSLFPPAEVACYQYYLRCQLSDDARIQRLGIVNDLQMTPLLLPEMVVGENHFVYTDESATRRKVCMTHEWVDRSAKRGPTVPVDVTMEADPERGVAWLRWKPNPVGRQPVRFRVYGSDEKGFTISDKLYDVNVGDQTDKLATPFPANFVIETPQTELVVVGAGLHLPNTNKAFYRVVAVDAYGKQSWSSDYATAPRPFIYSGPVVTAVVGAEYRYQMSVIRSLGDLTAREPLAINFWDIEKPVFSLEQAPEWLSVDASSGLLWGTPDADGDAKVVVRVTIDKEVRKLDEQTLSWGREKIIATATERVGSVTQEFVIRIR